MTKEFAAWADELFANFKIWLVVMSDRDRDEVKKALGSTYSFEVISLEDINHALEQLGGALA